MPHHYMMINGDVMVCYWRNAGVLTNNLGVHVLETEAAVHNGEDVLVHQRRLLRYFLAVYKDLVDAADVRDPGLSGGQELRGKSQRQSEVNFTVPISSTVTTACWLDTCGSWMRISQSVWLRSDGLINMNVVG